MPHLKILIVGELKRLFKYKIATVGIIVSLLWVGIIALSDKQSAPSLASLMLFTDAAIMSVLLLCASLYFEKQEGTLRTVLVTPCNKDEVIIAKVIASVFLGLISALIISISLTIIHSLSVNFLLILPAAILVVGFNSMIAIIISVLSKNFNNMLINYMFFIMLLILPTMLASLGVFGEVSEFASYLMLISPFQACQTIIDGIFYIGNTLQLALSYLYSAVATLLLYYFAVRKLFKKYAAGE